MHFIGVMTLFTSTYILKDPLESNTEKSGLFRWTSSSILRSGWPKLESSKLEYLRWLLRLHSLLVQDWITFDRVRNLENALYDVLAILIENGPLHSTESLTKSNVLQNVRKWLSITLQWSYHHSNKLIYHQTIVPPPKLNNTRNAQELAKSMY